MTRAGRQQNAADQAVAALCCEGGSKCHQFDDPSMILSQQKLLQSAVQGPHSGRAAWDKRPSSPAPSMSPEVKRGASMVLLNL